MYAVPEDHEPVTAIAIGYAGELERLPEQFRKSETSPRTRKDVNEFVFAGAWGNSDS